MADTLKQLESHLANKEVLWLAYSGWYHPRSGKKPMSVLFPDLLKTVADLRAGRRSPDAHFLVRDIDAQLVELAKGAEHGKIGVGSVDALTYLIDQRIDQRG